MCIYKFSPKIYYHSYVIMIMMTTAMTIQYGLKVCETVCSGVSTLQDHPF